MREQVAVAKVEREQMLARLQDDFSGLFSVVLPSDANFILCLSDQAERICRLLQQGIVVRLFACVGGCVGAVRVSVGLQGEPTVFECIGKFGHL